MTRRFHPPGAAPTCRGWIPRLCIALLGLGLIAPVNAIAGGADLMKDYLSGLRTLSSKFEQITLSADGGRMMESTGTFYLKRPGKFRWEYSAPDAQVIVADGDRVWLHDLELDQVSHKGQDSALSGTPAQLLANEEPIEKHFEVAPWDAGDERQWVELTPRANDTQVVKIRIGFIGDRLDTLLMEDSFGQLTRFSFTDTKRNPSLNDSLFRLPRSATSDFIEF
jgi:outer membrane lipoprotein carrier protein